MPRRTRRQLVGKWEAIEVEARARELHQLACELHREWYVSCDGADGPTATTACEVAENIRKLLSPAVSRCSL